MPISSSKNANVYTVALTIEDIQAGKFDFPIYPAGFAAAKDGKTIGVGPGDGGEFYRAGYNGY